MVKNRKVDCTFMMLYIGIISCDCRLHKCLKKGLLT